MKKLLGIVFASLMIATVFIFGFIVSQPARPQDLAAAQPIVQNVVDSILAGREAQIQEAGDDVSFGADDEINILALGIDSRKEGNEQHCDSIHMITLHLKDWSITITSVPRGTYSPLPPGGTYESYEYYLANACAYGGLDYGVKQIERVVGVKADYVATVGFSQALGIFRAFGLPTTDTLEWLRHRRGYQVGDPQRQHNQALFMKDTALKTFQGKQLPVPFLYLLYTFVDTDMDFQTVKALYDAYYVSQIGDRPDDIRVTMKPAYDVVDYHYNPTTVEDDLTKIVNFLKGKVSKDDLSLRSIDDVQSELVEYLKAALADQGSIEHVFKEQLWRQVEDDDTREELQFRFLDKYVREIKDADHDLAIQTITDYILEKEYFGLTDWEDRGKRFLESVASEQQKSP